MKMPEAFSYKKHLILIGTRAYRMKMPEAFSYKKDPSREKILGLLYPVF